MRKNPDELREKRLEAMRTKVRKAVDAAMQLLDTGESERILVRADLARLLLSLYAKKDPRKRPVANEPAKYVVHVCELQKWHQNVRVEVLARSKAEAAAKGVRIVVNGEPADRTDTAYFVESDSSDWCSLSVPGVPDGRLREALLAAGVRPVAASSVTGVPSIRSVLVELKE